MESKLKGKKRIVTVILVICVILVLVFFVNKALVLMEEFGKVTTKNQSSLISRELEHYTSEAFNSIEIVAMELSESLDEKGNLTKDPYYIIEKSLDRTPFDFIEYVDENGKNHLDGESTIDASQRPYFIDGIDGNTGVWINYNPQKSQEVLLDFYAPILFGDEPKGVLVGAIGADTGIMDSLNTSYFGRESIGVLTDSGNNLITATFPDHKNMGKEEIYKYFNLSSASRDKFDWHLENEISDPFVFEGNSGTAIGCIEFVNNTGWKVFIIIPSLSFSSVSAEFARIILTALAIIFSLFCIYIIYIVEASRAELAKENLQRKKIIDGFSKAYYSVFHVNLDENTGECFRTSDILSTKYGIKPDEQISYQETIVNYIFDSADSGEKYKLSFLINKKVLKGILKEREFYSVIFKNKTGESILISIALANEKKGQNEILIGLSIVNEFLEESKK